ncbi:MAG: LPS-assembly protein LptD, partial [Spirochaetales bacterium]|nr:LPS-assembly protein LptD [Spirochaetales bacterium]
MALRSFRSVFVLASMTTIILAAGAAWAQESPPVDESPTLESAATSGESPGGDSPEVAADDLFASTVAMDIASSDFYALVACARQLGLDDDGSAAQLRARLYGHYGVKEPPKASAAARTITIESADKTEYLSAREGGEATIVFSGRVALSVKDDETGEMLIINADSVVVNRDANILSARGDIVFERKKPGGTDYFMGEAMELDMDDWSGAFLDGESSQGAADDKKSGDDDALFFRADDILKRGSDVLVFRDGVVSSCDDDNPHYSIRASKIWILGGNEWAMLNATLSVGEVPLLYLPFFYYPGEEIVFHPVFGYDERFGRYVQTTTYLLGEKAPQEQEISLLKISEGDSGYARTVDGVFLRTTREKKEGSTTDFIKVMADLYSNLGGYLAAQTSIGALGPVKSISALAGLGVSRSLFLSADGTTYTPFVAATGYASDWNSLDLYGTELPIRFGWEFSASLEAGPLRLSTSAPFYSDPWFNRDFKDRSEDMNWLQFLDQETEETEAARTTSFADTLSASASVPAASLPAWLSAASLSRLSS